MPSIFKAPAPDDFRLTPEFLEQAKLDRIQMKKDLYMPILDDKKDLKPKEYLRQNVIDLEFILRQPSLYYPGAGIDLEPFKLFAQHSLVSTVIYCDYNWESARRLVKNDIYRKLKDCEVISTKRIEPDILGCKSWEDFWSSAPDAYSADPSDAFGLFAEIHFKPDNKTINFVYLCTEAIQTYKVLFSDRKIKPTVAVIDSYMCPLGFCGSDSELYEIAMPALPRYIYTGGKAWPGYDCVSKDETGTQHKRALYVNRGVAP